MSDLTVPGAVRSLLDAANRKDTPAFLSCFTADGVVDDWGRAFRGERDIRAWSDREFIGVAVSLTVRDVENTEHAGGTRSRVVAEVGGDGFNGPSTFTFETVGDRVSRMEIRG